MNVELGRDHVVVAGQTGGDAGLDQFARMGDQPLEPSQLVVELAPGLGIAVER